MTIKQQIIFSSTFVAIIAALAAYMSWKNTQPIQQELVYELSHTIEEIRFLDEIKANLDGVRSEMLEVLSLMSRSTEEDVNVYTGKGALINARIKTLQIQIKSLGEFSQQLDSVNTTKDLLSLSEDLRIGVQLLFEKDSQLSKQQIAKRGEIKMRKTTDEFDAVFLQADQQLFNKIKKEGESAKAQISTLNFWIILAGGSIFLMAIVFGQVIAYYLSQSLAQLKAAAEHLRAGKYSTRVALNSKNEFGKIGETFDTLAADLEQSKIIEMQKQELEHLNEELKTKNDSLDRFVYRVSHDLKAPVVNIKSLLSLIQDRVDTSSSPEAAQSFIFLEQSTEKLQRTIFDLLEVSRIERSLTITKEWLDISTVIEQVKNENREYFKEQEVRIMTDLQVSSIYFSKTNFYSILSNMIGNSVKYKSPQRPPVIYLKTTQKDNFICLEIKDDGIGIDLEKHRDKLFGMFNRFHNHVDGSGVGLYIVKKILDATESKIEVESKEGEGSLFKLFFNQTTARTIDETEIVAVNEI